MSYGPDAGWYSTWAETAVVHQLAIPAVLDLCGSGGEILDVACGHGLFTRMLARTGRHVTGVDLSAGLIDLARAEESRAPLGIEYMVADAASLEGLADGSFDGVTCCLALTDIDDLEGMFAATHRVLRPGGWLAVATVHPCFEPPHSRKLDVDGRRWTQVAHYFEEGRWYSPPGDGPRAKAGTYHRRLSTILNLLVDTGFRLDRLSEPKGPPELLETNPNYGEVAEILGIRASR